MNSVMEIKRLAQMMFDNADYFATQLSKSDNYRWLHIHLDCHKNHGGDETLCSTVWMGDEKKHVGFIKGEVIEIETLKREWQSIDQAVGAEPLPKSIEIRTKL